MLSRTKEKIVTLKEKIKTTITFIDFLRAPVTFDVAYQKLKCYSQDSHTDFYPDPLASDPGTPIFACHFCLIPSYKHFVALANEDGRIAILDTRKPRNYDTTFMSVQGHNNAIFDLIWANSDKKLISASGDHTAAVWDIGEGEIKPILTFHGHTRSVKTITCKPYDYNVFATGARDGMINIWDFRSNIGNIVKPENSISLSYPVSSGSSQKVRRTPHFRSVSITGLVFQDEHTLISCSAGDGAIKIWDLRKSYSIYKREPQPRHVLLHAGKTTRNGFTCLTVSPCGLKLFANCIDNTLYAYNIGTYNKEPIAIYKGHMTSSFYIKHTVSPDGRYIASGSSDEKAYIWSVNCPDKPIISLNGHTAEVTCIDWCTEGEIKMATCSDDGSYRIWRLHPEECHSQHPDLKGTAVECERVCESEVAKCKRKKSKTVLLPKTLIGPEGSANVDEMSGDTPLTSSDPSTVCTKRPRICSSVDDEVCSPTSHLPNYVIDGTSPHHHRCTPVTKPTSPNWLNVLRKRTPNGTVKPILIRRRSANRQSSAKESLLKFFKVAAKQPQNVTCDQPLNSHVINEETTSFT